MNFKAHFDQIHSFLKEHQLKWELEIINHYPHSMEGYDNRELDELDKLSHEDLYLIDCMKDISKFENLSFYPYLKKIRELTTIEKVDLPPVELPPWAWDRVKFKKKHEISRLAPFLKKTCENNNFSHAVDIGGGKGHLSRVLAHYLKVPTICLDQDERLQKLGKERLEKFPKPDGAKDVNFVNMTFGKNEKDLENIFTKDALTVGLHTCGPLANAHITHSINQQTKALVNFGCCYIKLNPTSDINISKHAQEKALNFNKFTLTLATRGHNEMSEKDFETKKRVKYYRYALHLLMVEKLNINEFLTAGNAPVKLYYENFSSYALTKLKELNIPHNFEVSELDEFFTSERIQKILRRLFLANILRWQLGRVIEHYILTDRCLYLEENQFIAKLYEVFDQKVSPRNLAIEAHRL